MEVFSFPLRTLPNGRIATVEQGTPAAHAEAVAMLVMTRIGERPLVPSCGIPDPMFHTVNEHDVRAAVSTFLPDVQVRSIAIDQVTGRNQMVHVELGDASAQS